MSFSVCPSFCLFYDSLNCLFAEMRDFLVLHNFLCYKNCNLVPVFFCIGNSLFHVYFISIPADSAPQCRVHVPYCFCIASSNKYEIAWHRLCPHHRSCRSFALSCYSKPSFLQCRQHLLLCCGLQGCNLVYKQDSHMALVYHACNYPFMSWCSQPS